MKETRDDGPCSCGSGKTFGQCCRPLEPSAQVSAVRLPQAVVPVDIRAGLAHQHAGRFAEAAAIYRQVLQTQPDHSDALHLLGLLAYHEGKLDAAMELIMSAISVVPTAIYYGNLGNVLAGLGKSAAAGESFRQAIALQPDYVPAHNNLGNMLRTQGEFEAAVQSFRNAIAFKPDYAEAYNNLANALVDLGDLEGAIEYYRKTIAFRPDLAEPHSNLLFILNYHDATSPQEYLAEAIRFGDQVTLGSKPFSQWDVDRQERGTLSTRALRIGFVSGDLKTHPVGFFLESILAHLDSRRVEIIAYTTRRDEDALTARIKPHFAAWHSLAGLSDEAAARKIHADRIDILVDLAGHTNFNRLPVFAWKPAPLQVSWLGYFATTGLRAIDYVLADRHVLPPEEEAQFVERPWCLPDSYLCFTPPAEGVAVGALPMLAEGLVTFGCFNHLMKMNDTVVAVWARVLHEVPGSRLFLKAEQLNDAFARRTTIDRFAALGIDAGRLILEGRSPRTEYLEAYNRVDIALSPFPYPGGTVSVEGLWMGVPVLCRRGDRFLSHLCESLLHSADLSDWIAADNDDYVAKAVAFAKDRCRLGGLRASLRARLMKSPLCDAPRFAENLTSAFINMWRRHIAPTTFPNTSTMHDVNSILEQALAHHQAGRLADAKARYEQILAVMPTHPDALHFLGLLACELEERDAGIALMHQSIAANPSPIYYNNLGNALRDNGELMAAIDGYRNAIALKQDYAEAHNNLGNALREAGDARASMESCASAIELRPGYAEAYNNLGNALQDLGELEAAAMSYRKAVASRPDFSEAHHNLGNVLKATGDLDGAIECYCTSLALTPDLAVVHHSLAVALTMAGKYRAAVESYRKVVDLKPDDAEANNVLGVALLGQWRVAEALPYFERAIELAPDHALAYHNLANAQLKVGQIATALITIRKALSLRDDLPSFHNNLGTILADLTDFDGAVASSRKAVQLNPNFAESHTCLLFGQSYCGSWSPQTHLDDARYFGARMTALARPYTHDPAERTPGQAARPLRVGFVSADLRKHPVGYFLESVLGHLNRERFEWVAYSNGMSRDELTDRIKPRFAVWRNVAELNDEAFARLIREDDIDILVDLGGHTANNRLPVFAWKAAPVQVSWLGYFATTGIAEIDYLLADWHVLPESEEWHFVETPWRLPDSYLCFTLPEQEVPIGPLPASRSDVITFGCFNNQKKLNDRVIAVWSRLLHAMPRSRLLLKNHQLTDAWTRHKTIERFAAHDITEDRLVLEGPSARDEYFAAFNRVDIALDPFPYPGGTTSVEGLWMGVPVIARRGDRFLSHLADSILNTVGLPDWIADSDDDYIARAVAFASDLPRLATLRGKLRAQILASPLCDASRYASNLEAAFEQMWQRYLGQS